MRSRATVFAAAIGALLLAGCVPPFVDMAADGGGSGEPAETSTTTIGEQETEDAEREPSAEAGDGEGDDGSPPDSVGFIIDPDGGGVSFECDLWAQDCPAGEKCNMWANDGGNSWNATKCVPIAPEPDDPGEPCTVLENGVSGVDSCVLGAICWNVDPDTNAGVCVAFCIGSEANPTCPDPTQHCTGRDFMLCLTSCCPLLQDCAEGEACYPDNHTFECVADAGGEQGAFGDSCEYLNVCDPGLFCAAPDTVPDCEGSSGCCTPFCDLSDPSATENCPGADGGQECVAWFEEGQAPPGEENVGACFIPA